MIFEELISALTGLSAQLDAKRILVVCRAERPLNWKHCFPEGTCITWLSDIRTVDDLSKCGRADFGLVFDQLEHMNKAEGSHLLGRLRDHHCRKVVLHYTGREFANQELLALGFIEQEIAPTDGRIFLFDPNIYFSRRDWNTPDKWAHPENFKKYRW